jgi:hypothetical protein
MCSPVLTFYLDKQIGRILAGQSRMVQLATENQSMTELLEIVLPHCLSVSLGKNQAIMAETSRVHVHF